MLIEGAMPGVLFVVEIVPPGAIAVSVRPAPNPFLDEHCFPAGTLVSLPNGSVRLIEAIGLGDVVAAFEHSGDLGRGVLVQGRVVHLYRSITTEWIKLTWDEDGETRELVSTPGHHFLDQFGQFPTIEAMLKNGSATVVLASGELIEVSVERIVYSAETAHMFECAVAHSAVAGNAALQPVELDAWTTYNFEVEELHTYVAGGVRVHNESGFFGKIGNLFSAGEDRLGSGPVKALALTVAD
jgi:hypothetical protein